MHGKLALSANITREWVYVMVNTPVQPGKRRTAQLTSHRAAMVTQGKENRTMAQVEWDGSLSVGFELIDAQHKQWIQHLNDVDAAVKAHHGPDKIAAALLFLANYTQTHFDTEERVMAEHAYTDLDAHRAKHESMKVTLADLVTDFEEEGATHELANAIDNLLVNWLARHIKEVDTLLAAFLKEKGITPA